MAEKSDGYQVPAAIRVARIIKLLARETRGHRMVEIARKLDMNRSTCHNTLRTLRDEGVVHYDKQLKLYGIGLPLITSLDRLSQVDWGLYPVLSKLQELSNRLSMTIILGDASGLKSIRLLSRTYPKNSMALNVSDFESVPLLSGSMGRVVAAWGGLPEHVLKAAFEESGHESFLSFADFMEDTARAKACGWAIDDGTWQRGIWGMAAPIPDAGGKVEHILCLTCASGAVPPDRLAEIGRALIQTANHIADRAS